MTVATLWNDLSHLGVKPQMPHDLRKKVVLCNRISATVFVAIGATSFQFFQVPPLFALYALATLCYGTPLLFNLLGRYTLARAVFVFSPPVFIVLVSGLSADGPSLNLKFQLLSVMITPVVLFQITEGRWMWTGLAWVGLSFAFFDPLSRALPRLAEIPNDQAFDNPTTQNLSLTLSLVLFVAGFVYQQWINRSTEQQLAVALASAEAQTQVIRDQHEQLQTQYEAIEHQNQAIEQINHELRLQALKAQINPHFVFNALNSIQHFIMQKNPLEAIGYLAKFAKLIRQVLENSVNERVPIADELKALGYYLELEKLRFGDAFAYHIEVDEQVDVYNTEVPAMLLQPYVENAILHGLRHRAAPGGQLTVWVLHQFDHLLCVVEDNGIGRAASAALSANRPAAGHVSRGTSLTDTRLRLLNQDVGVMMTDRHAPDGGAAGTRVEITIPLEMS